MTDRITSLTLHIAKAMGLVAVEVEQPGYEARPRVTHLDSGDRRAAFAPTKDREHWANVMLWAIANDVDADHPDDIHKPDNHEGIMLHMLEAVAYGTGWTGE